MPNVTPTVVSPFGNLGGGRATALNYYPSNDIPPYTVTELRGGFAMNLYVREPAKWMALARQHPDTTIPFAYQHVPDWGAPQEPPPRAELKRHAQRPGGIEVWRAELPRKHDAWNRDVLELELDASGRVIKATYIEDGKRRVAVPR